MGEDLPETARNLDGIQPRYINWFPGHMLKAEKDLSGQLKRVDAVLELRDARIPLASVNPRFEKNLGTKQRLILFNKTALADEQVTQAWFRFFHPMFDAFYFGPEYLGMVLNWGSLVLTLWSGVSYVSKNRDLLSDM